MDTFTYERQEEDSDRHDDDPPDRDRVPGRPRRQYFNRWSAALVALVTCAVGFYAGVRVEKSQVSGSSATPSTAAAFAARPRALSGGSAGAGGSGAAGPAGASGAGRAGGAGGFGGGGASFGTVSSVKGNTLYLTDTSGNTVKATLSGSTKVSKSLAVKRKSIRPGDTVVIQGLKNSSGTLVAASVSDSGTGASGLAGLFGRGGSAAGGGSGPGGSRARPGSGSNSGVSSLFSPSGGG